MSAVWKRVNSEPVGTFGLPGWRQALTPPWMNIHLQLQIEMRIETRVRCKCTLTHTLWMPRKRLAPHHASPQLQMCREV